MSNLDNLTLKIIADAEARAAEITAAAQRQAQEAVAQQEAAAEKEKEAIILQAETDAERTREQMIQGKTLAIRDENLGAKQEMLDKVFGMALERLESMDKDAYWQFVSNYLANLDTDGEEIFFPARYNVTSVDELNSFLKSKGKKGNLVLGNSASRDIRGGFVLAKNGIEQNNTFAALVDYYRYELEGEVLSTLY